MRCEYVLTGAVFEPIGAPLQEGMEGTMLTPQLREKIEPAIGAAIRQFYDANRRPGESLPGEVPGTSEPEPSITRTEDGWQTGRVVIDIDERDDGSSSASVTVDDPQLSSGREIFAAQVGAMVNGPTYLNGKRLEAI